MEERDAPHLDFYFLFKESQKKFRPSPCISADLVELSPLRYVVHPEYITNFATDALRQDPSPESHESKVPRIERPPYAGT